MSEKNDISKDLDNFQEAVEAGQIERDELKLEEFNQNNADLILQNPDWALRTNEYLEKGYNLDLSAEMAQQDYLKALGKEELTPDLMTYEQRKSLNAEDFRQANKITQLDDSHNPIDDAYKPKSNETSAEFAKRAGLSYRINCEYDVVKGKND